MAQNLRYDWLDWLTGAEGNGVFYLLGDQVKSTSVIASRAGVQADERIALIRSGVQIAPRHPGNPSIP